MTDETYEKWQDDYYNNRIIDLKNIFKDNLETLKKLDIYINDGLYTKYEYECIKTEILWYYKEPDDTKEELKFTKSIEDKGVSPIEFDSIIYRMEKICIKYGI